MATKKKRPEALVRVERDPEAYRRGVIRTRVKERPGASVGESPQRSEVARGTRFTK